jgi:hypothetical protein
MDNKEHRAACNFEKSIRPVEGRKNGAERQSMKGGEVEIIHNRENVLN